jgi:hypothetical protein
MCVEERDEFEKKKCKVRGVDGMVGELFRGGKYVLENSYHNPHVQLCCPGFQSG